MRLRNWQNELLKTESKNIITESQSRLHDTTRQNDDGKPKQSY